MIPVLNLVSVLISLLGSQRKRVRHWAFLQSDPDIKSASRTGSLAMKSTAMSRKVRGVTGEPLGDSRAGFCWSRTCCLPEPIEPLEMSSSEAAPQGRDVLCALLQEQGSPLPARGRGAQRRGPDLHRERERASALRKDAALRAGKGKASSVPRWAPARLLQ